MDAKVRERINRWGQELFHRGGREREKKRNKLWRPHAWFHAVGNIRMRTPVSRGIRAFSLFGSKIRRGRGGEPMRTRRERETGRGKRIWLSAKRAKIANGTTRGTMLNSLGNNGWRGDPRLSAPRFFARDANVGREFRPSLSLSLPTHSFLLFLSSVELAVIGDTRRRSTTNFRPRIMEMTVFLFR